MSRHHQEQVLALLIHTHSCPPRVALLALVLNAWPSRSHHSVGYTTVAGALLTAVPPAGERPQAAGKRAEGKAGEWLALALPGCA